MARKPDDLDKLLALAAENGYEMGKHREKDAEPCPFSYVDKVIYDQDVALNRYVLWSFVRDGKDFASRGLSPPTMEMTKEHCLDKGAKLPDMDLLKDFFRFQASVMKGKIEIVSQLEQHGKTKPDKKTRKKPTDDSVCTFAEHLFAGFTRVTRTAVSKEDRSEIYNWVRTTLVEEGLVIHIKKSKENFTKRDLDRALIGVLDEDELALIHPRSLINFIAILLLYCETGARLSAFFEGGGLRWRDLSFALQREGKAEWRPIYKIQQRWVKNNKHPGTVSYDAAGKDHRKLRYNRASLLMTLAIADGAIFGYESINDLLEQQIPEGQDEVPLRFYDHALDRPIFRGCTLKDGVTDRCMTKKQFMTIWKTVMAVIGYQKTPTPHHIRRQLGKQINAKYTGVDVSQHLTQNDQTVFGRYYVANTSSVAGMEAFLGEDTDLRHVEYFQSLERYFERGLPSRLPARRRRLLMNDPDLVKLQAEAQTLSGEARKKAKGRAKYYWQALEREALKEYKDEWLRESRDRKVLSRGKVQASGPREEDRMRIICSLLPERGRLREVVIADENLSPEATWNAMRDVCSLLGRDLSTCYLPGLEPSEGLCPEASCRLDLKKLSQSRRNRHILRCVSEGMAHRLMRPVKDIHYCYECFSWAVGDCWEDHCQAHLSVMRSKRCGTITQWHALLRPGYCPECLGKKDSPASKRMASWTRDHQLWGHMDEIHLQGCSWPRPCGHPLCDVVLKDDEDLLCHFVDDHGFSPTRPRRLARSNASAADGMCEDLLRPPKRARPRGDACEGGLGLACETICAPEDPPLPQRPAKRARKTSRAPLPASRIPTCEEDEHLEQERLKRNTPILSYSPNNVRFRDTLTRSGLERPDHPWTLEAPDPALTDPIGDKPFSLDLGSQSPDVDMDVLFSQYLRSPSPCSSTEQQSACSSETLVAASTESSCFGYGAKQDSMHASDSETNLREKRHANTEAPRIRLLVSTPQLETAPPILRRSQEPSCRTKPRVILHVKPPKYDMLAKRTGKRKRA